jgi:PhnB protein
MPRKSLKPVPKGMRTITPALNFKDNCIQAIEFYKKAFNAEVIGNIAKGPDGKVLHALMKVDDSCFMLSDVMGQDKEQFGLRANMWMYVAKCDSMFTQAVAAGAKILYPMTDQFWGDRVGALVDPFNHLWSIATLKWILTPEEMQKGQDEWFKSSKK